MRRTLTLKFAPKGINKASLFVVESKQKSGHLYLTYGMKVRFNSFSFFILTIIDSKPQDVSNGHLSELAEVDQLKALFTLWPIGAFVSSAQALRNVIRMPVIATRE